MDGKKSKERKNLWNYFVHDMVGDKELMLRYKPNKIEMIW